MMRRLLAVLTAVAVLCLIGAPAAGAAQEDPPLAGQCDPGFFLATIAGSTSCQPAPQIIVPPAAQVEPPLIVASELPPVEPATAPPATEPAPAPATPPAPIEAVVEAPAVLPIVGCAFSYGGWICFGALPPSAPLRSLHVAV